MHIQLVINNGPQVQCWTTFPGEPLEWKWKVGSYGRIAACQPRPPPAAGALRVRAGSSHMPRPGAARPAGAAHSGARGAAHTG
ncbi:hypothetical protein OH809_40975 [Streptomyces sp. NBC_00873]|uniref:hypothetical protein n=1 Tax=unclassified Streptomyces TaxID=2593676 RepID=UPI0038655A9C|nr:hypothetical protein OH809_40975 [Streptomyces sp. NBC_00873]WTA41710.1 hypothetical protein OH821_02725 [Streptomyces sp. NBC_00842]